MIFFNREARMEITGNAWTKYRRKRTSVIELRPYIWGESLEGISVRDQDHPTLDRGMIARNPDNHAHKWYVARDYFEKHYEEDDGVDVDDICDRAQLGWSNALEENSKLKAELEEARRHADGWGKCAADMKDRSDFYQGIVRQIGDMFGIHARTSDDGSVQDDVLALKVPELVAKMFDDLGLAKAQRNDAERHLRDAKVPKSDWQKLQAERDELRRQLKDAQAKLLRIDIAVNGETRPVDPTECTHDFINMIRVPGVPKVWRCDMCGDELVGVSKLHAQGRSSTGRASDFDSDRAGSSPAASATPASADPLLTCTCPDCPGHRLVRSAPEPHGAKSPEGETQGFQRLL